MVSPKRLWSSVPGHDHMIETVTQNLISGEITQISRHCVVNAPPAVEIRVTKCITSSPARFSISWPVMKSGHDQSCFGDPVMTAGPRSSRENAPLD